VGTGFHSELTGRENIYLNGAILGMTRAEIRRKFDEIVAFAEVEKFLDTPVKRYSSGMYVRLAFAVAAHLEPEILIVDEVLAVGDGEFQKKCLGKMEEVASRDRTVLLVSHNMGTIGDLTERTALLEHGRIAKIGKSQDVIEAYLTRSQVPALRVNGLEFYRRSRNSEAPVTMVGLAINRAGKAPGESIPTIEIGSELQIEVDIDVIRPLTAANLTMILKTATRQHIAVLASYDQKFDISVGPGRHTIAVRLGSLPLAPGLYYLDVGIDASVDVCYESISDFPLCSVVNKGEITYWLDRPWGLLHCSSVEWSVSEATTFW
jgi:lipopolysaccharide transport system ATP-binding protein